MAAHVLGRRRFEVTGRFGLRVTPGGIGTPAFGEPLEVVRIAGTNLVHEKGGDVRIAQMTGMTLRGLAGFVGAEIGREFSVGRDTPPLGDPDSALELDAVTAGELAEWFSLGWEVLDAYLAQRGAESAPTTIQLWPEHFDAGTSVTLGGGQRVNVGFSAGDDFEPEPYAYFGPWAAVRPGDASYWNAPFGAVLRHREMVEASDSVGRAMDFLLEGGLNMAAETSL